jgi:hypothetical protein
MDAMASTNEPVAPAALAAPAEPAAPAPKPWFGASMDDRCTRIYAEFHARVNPRIDELEAEIEKWEHLAERAEFRLDRIQRAAGVNEGKEMALMDELARYETFLQQTKQALKDFRIYNDYRAHLEQSVDSLRDLLEDNRTEWLRLERRLEKPDLAPEVRADLEARNAAVKQQGNELWAEFEAFNEEWRRYDDANYQEEFEEPEPDQNWVRAMIGNPGRDI